METTMELVKNKRMTSLEIAEVTGKKTRRCLGSN